MPSPALTPAERATLRESGEFIVQYVVPQTIGTVFWGIYLVIASKAFTILWCKGIRNSRPRAVLLVMTILMFLLSTTLLLVSWAEFFVQVSYLFLGTGNFPTLEDRLLAADVYKYKLYFAYLLIFQIEVLLGDSIVIWRTWAIWSDTPRAVIFPIILWLSSLVLLIVSASIFTEYDYIYTASQAVSIASNGLATALIAYRAWSHRHMLKLVGCSPSTLTEKILALLVESGCIYLFMVLFDVVAQSLTLSAYNSWSIFINSFDSIVAQTLGLYPTVIIILVEGRKTAWDDNTPHRASTTIVLTSNMGSSVNPIESDWEMGSTRQTRSSKSDA